MNSGIYIRVETENKLLEQMTTEERHNWLNEKFYITKYTDSEPLVKIIDVLCETLEKLENDIDILTEDEENDSVWNEEENM